LSREGGTFITLEGPEGCGKSTQAGLLAEDIRRRGREVVLTAEPGGAPICDQIRSILLEPKEGLAVEAELLLYLAARAQHVREVILPALRRGACVISDRYADSSVAYQGYGRGVDLEVLDRLNAFATGGLMPDLTILLDLSVEVGLERQKQRNRFEAESADFHRKVAAGFRELAGKEPGRWAVIDARGSVEAVAARIRQCVEDRGLI
jgi:dTMP kinase